MSGVTPGVSDPDKDLGVLLSSPVGSPQAGSSEEIASKNVAQGSRPVMPTVNGDARALDGSLYDQKTMLAEIRELKERIRVLSVGTQQEQSEAGQHDYSNAGDFPHRRTHLPKTPRGGWTLEVNRFKRVKNRFGSHEVYEGSEKIEDIKKRERDSGSGGHILSIYEEYNVEMVQTSTVLQINSAPLIEHLRKIITYYPGEEIEILRGKDSIGDTVVLSQPYMILFTYRKALEKSLGENHPPEALSHTRLLLDFMEKECPRTSNKLAELESGRCEKLYFKDLWLLYPPNTAVYTTVQVGRIRQLVVYSRQSSWNPHSEPPQPFQLQCWDVSLENRNFVRNWSIWTIEPYIGEKNIANLGFIPVRYCDGGDQLREDLIQRGKRYCTLSQHPQLQDYWGDLFLRVYKDEPVRVVVDEDTYWRKNPTRTKLVIEDPSLSIEDPSKDYGFPEEERSLVDKDGKPRNRTLVRCWPAVGVFSLRDKEWALVSIDDLKDVKFKEKAFKKVVIKDEYKQIVKAMVEAYTQEQPGFSDIVSGKGRGLTVLLHGPPGTGKTLTAESIAEREKRPLFSVSCGDLGIEPATLEEKIKEVFEYAAKWKAILLLDEADVFLQERSINNLQRNALVSIFLRELEYFDGILFLTTNRPGEIDEAFASRIHITLGLQAFTVEERKKVWTVFIKDLPIDVKSQKELLNKVEKEFEKDNINGRQIRNCVRTALAMAKLQNRPVEFRDFETVMKIGREYKTYVEGVYKMPAEERAQELAYR